MAQDTIDEILKAKRQAEKPAEETAKQEDKFFSVLGGEGLHEDFLELRMREGNWTCFSYSDLMWFNYDPKEGCIDLAFGEFMVQIKGRGLVPRLWQGIKNKRVAWLKESDEEMQDHKDNETFIEGIFITPPSASEETASESAE